MKIGIIIDFEAKPHNGGAYSYLSLFINHLLVTSTNHKFVVISNFKKEVLSAAYTFPAHQEFYSLPAIKRLKLRFVSLVSKLCWKLKFFSMLRTYLERYEKNQYTKAFKIAGIQSICYLPYNKVYTLDIPFFFHVWDIGHRTISVFPEVSNDGLYKYREDIYSEALPRAYRVIAETLAGKEDIKFYYRIKKEKIMVAPMFAGDVIYKEYTSEEAEQFMVRNDLKKDHFLFYPAQFWAHKNHVNLLLAFKIILTQFPSMKLVLCGGDKGNLKFVKDNVARLQLQKQVVFPGFLDDQKYIKMLYENASALVMPTFLGPSNMPLLEAMALRCPVICSDLKGHRELGGNHFLYINPQDAQSIADSVLFLLNNPDLRDKRTKEAFDYYKNSNYHISKNIESIVSEFDQFEKVRQCWE